ncbi:WD40 domain-containing protein, partial [Thecamonas trahens ATCC 50062]
VLEGHIYDVNGVIALPSADGQLPVLVSWSDDKTIRVWHPADDGTGAMRYTADTASCKVLEGHTGDVNGVIALPSADSQLPVLVSWSRDRTIRVWHAADDGTGAMRYTADSASCEVLEGYIYNVNGVIALPSADGQLPILVSWSRDRTIRVWHAADDGTGAMRYTADSASCEVLEGHTTWVNGVIALPSADGQLPVLVSWSDDKTIRVWHAAYDGTGAMRYTADSASCEVLEGHIYNVWGVIALPSADGQLPVLVSWSRDNTIRVWHAADDGTGAMRYTEDSASCEVLKGHTSGVEGVIALPSADGQLPVLVSWSWDNTIRVWHAADDGSGAVWYTADRVSCEVLEGHIYNVRGVIALPSADGQLPVLVSWSIDKTVRVWHAADDGTGAMRYTADRDSCEVLEGHTDDVEGVIALPSADSQLPVLVSWSWDRTIRVWHPVDDGT